MTLIVTITFDHQGVDLGAQYTDFARQLEQLHPREWARVLAVFSDALGEYAERVDAALLKFNTRLDEEAARDAQA